MCLHVKMSMLDFNTNGQTRIYRWLEVLYYWVTMTYKNLKLLPLRLLLLLCREITIEEHTNFRDSKSLRYQTEDTKIIFKDWNDTKFTKIEEIRRIKTYELDQEINRLYWKDQHRGRNQEYHL